MQAAREGRMGTYDVQVGQPRTIDPQMGKLGVSQSQVRQARTGQQSGAPVVTIEHGQSGHPAVPHRQPLHHGMMFSRRTGESTQGMHSRVQKASGVHVTMPGKLYCEEAPGLQDATELVIYTGCADRCGKRVLAFDGICFSSSLLHSYTSVSNQLRGLSFCDLPLYLASLLQLLPQALPPSFLTSFLSLFGKLC